MHTSPRSDRLRAGCALAGGVFANVKLNERLAELDNVEEVYIFPNMGSTGGLSVGSAWLAASRSDKPGAGNVAVHVSRH